MSEKLEELISLLYQDKLTQYGKRLLVKNIEKLQKENEKLKNKLLDNLEGQKVIKEETPQYIKENYIPVQKVKDKIEEYKNMLKTCNKAKYIDRIKAINERILELEELLEGRK